jgi:hypothetical protein
MKMNADSSPGFESYFGAALVACGISWLWDYISSLYFPGQTALNFTILSAFVYMEAALLGAFGLTRRMPSKQIHVGLRAGLGAFLLNTVFRLIVFEFVEALWGVIIYFVSFIAGGITGGFLAKTLHRSEIRKNEVSE